MLVALLSIAVSSLGTVTSTTATPLTAAERIELKRQVEEAFVQKRICLAELAVCVADKGELREHLANKLREIAALRRALAERPVDAAGKERADPRIRSPPLLSTLGVVLSSSLCASGAAALGAEMDKNRTRGAAVGAGAGALVCGAAVLLGLTL